MRPRSVISGYPIPPAYTLSRYDEDYSYLANLANRTVGPLNEQIGPKNAIILQPEVDLHCTAPLGIYLKTLKTLFVCREDTADGLYDTPGFLVLPWSVNSQRYVGASPQVLIAQQLGRHSSVSLNYYHFYRGGFLTSQTRTKDVDYFSIWVSYTS
jgi:hypothetical protein